MDIMDFMDIMMRHSVNTVHKVHLVHKSGLNDVAYLSKMFRCLEECLFWAALSFDHDIPNLSCQRIGKHFFQRCRKIQISAL